MMDDGRHFDPFNCLLATITEGQIMMNSTRIRDATRPCTAVRRSNKKASRKMRPLPRNKVTMICTRTAHLLLLQLLLLILASSFELSWCWSSSSVHRQVSTKRLLSRHSSSSSSSSNRHGTARIRWWRPRHSYSTKTTRLWSRRYSPSSSSSQHPIAPVVLETPRQQQDEAVKIKKDKNGEDPSLGFSTNGLSRATDAILLSKDDNSMIDQSESTRRIFFASSLIAAGLALGATTGSSPASATTTMASRDGLQYEVSPVNKRTGVTVFEAEQAGFNIRFVTYLSRFLLVFDADCQRWWYTRAGDIPRGATSDEVNEFRLSQFGAFSASVEVGLQEYRDVGKDNNGPKILLQSLLKRYCPDMKELKASREAAGLPPLSEQAEQKQEREIREARRQIALLFGLMDKNQPVEEITKLLAAIDNGCITSIRILDPGSGYAPGYGPPLVTFPPPEAGPNYNTATGRAVLSPNGRILRIDLVNRGFGYSKAPVVTIAPPAATSFATDVNVNFMLRDQPKQAEAKAFIFKSGVNKGRIERVQVTQPGAGYTLNEAIKVRITPPELLGQDGGVTATATAVLEYEVTDILIVNNGTGYAVEKPIPVTVEPPPVTARVNMNDPLMARIIDKNQPLPPTTIPSREMLKKMPSVSDPTSVAAMASSEANKAGDCIGRGCYDRPVVAVAYPKAEKDSYDAFRSEDDALTIQKIESALNVRGVASAAGEAASKPRIVSASTSGGTDGKKSSNNIPGYINFSGGGKSSSSQLLSLLPAGVGLEFNEEEGRYQLASDPSVVDMGTEGGQQIADGGSGRAIDPEFGPRGRSPIEREMELGIATYLRFVASGAICSSGVHLALTPIDVVKTKVQTDPKNYPSVLPSFDRVWKEQGLEGFFKGWAPTFLGFFVWGGVSYALTEFLRRAITDLAGADAAQLEVPIILLSAGLAAFVGSFILCPFEAVRIRSVAQPNYAPNIVQVCNRMIAEEGIPSLFSAVPAFLLKEIPFAMAKFTVFDLSTAWLYDRFPAATEDLQLSLLVSLTGGTFGGIVAAIVSNPADVTISEMKKAKSDLGPKQAAQAVLDRGGPQALFTGLPLRLVFYSLIVSLQFLVYDSVRIALGIGADDLKLYLDVLGGALSESGGPV